MTYAELIERHRSLQKVDWFAASDYFGSQYIDKPIKLPLVDQDTTEEVHLFLSSEKGPHKHKRYTVRAFWSESGRITTIGPFCVFTKGEAQDFLALLTRAPRRLEDILKAHEETHMSNSFEEVHDTFNKVFTGFDEECL